MTRNAESIQPVLAIVLYLINGLVCFIDKSVYFDSLWSLFVSIVYRYELYMPKLKAHSTDTFHIQNIAGQRDRSSCRYRNLHVQKNEEISTIDREFML